MFIYLYIKIYLCIKICENMCTIGLTLKSCIFPTKFIFIEETLHLFCEYRTRFYSLFRRV